MTYAVLIIEDEATLAKNMATYLRRHGYEIKTAAGGKQALAQMSAFQPDVVLVDYSLPGMDGLDVLRRLRAEHPQVKAIMITGHGSVEIAVKAMKAGAHDYLSKPVALSELKLIVDKVVEQNRLEGKLSYYREKEASTSGLDKLLGESPPMRALKDAVRRLIDAECGLKDRDPPAVLLTGETGSGKQLVARAIHYDGPRRDGPFVEINCASIPASLVESELFGFERGAFTDARERKRGLVELAQDGTLFLDEIGELDLAIQAKLLKLIEEKAVRRLGALREQRALVRIIASTNQDLERLTGEGRFRADLFFRLRIVYLHMPPLRLRGHDILLLARHFLAQHGARYGKPRLTFSPSAEKMLLEYSWPGNVRELRNRLEQIVLMSQRDQIEPEQLALGSMQPPDDPGISRDAAGVPLLPEQGVALEQVEQALVRQALVRTHWNVTRAAKLLGLSRDTLRYRMEKYELKPPV